MADKKISELDSATLPLAGTELIPIVQSGVTKQCAVNEIIIGAIPLSGTTTGNSITGDLEFQESAKNLWVKGPDYPNDYYTINFAEGGISLNYINEDTGDTNNITISQNALTISSDNPTSKGITGIEDYTPNITDLDYTQKKYTDTKLPIETPATTGVSLTFVTDRVYGSIASPETGNITADVTGAKLGVTNIIIHNSGTAPTFDSKFKKLSGSGSYVISVVNYIYCTYINATEIIYSINQRT